MLALESEQLENVQEALQRCGGGRSDEACRFLLCDCHVTLAPQTFPLLDLTALSSGVDHAYIKFSIRLQILVLVDTEARV